MDLDEKVTVIHDNIIVCRVEEVFPEEELLEIKIKKLNCLKHPYQNSPMGDYPEKILFSQQESIINQDDILRVYFHITLETDPLSLLNYNSLVSWMYTQTVRAYKIELIGDEGRVLNTFIDQELSKIKPGTY